MGRKKPPYRTLRYGPDGTLKMESKVKKRSPVEEVAADELTPLESPLGVIFLRFKDIAHIDFSPQSDVGVCLIHCYDGRELSVKSAYLRKYLPKPPLGSQCMRRLVSLESETSYLAKRLKGEWREKTQEEKTRDKAMKTKKAYLSEQYDRVIADLRGEKGHPPSDLTPHKLKVKLACFAGYERDFATWSDSLISQIELEESLVEDN